MLNPGEPPHQLPPAGPHGGSQGGFSELQQPHLLPLHLQNPPQHPPLVGGLLPVVGHLDYMARYQDASSDPYQLRYNGLTHVFAVPMQGATTTPANLMTQVGDSTNAGVPSAFLMLVEDLLNPLHPGKIMCFHRVTKFPAGLGSLTP